MFGSRTVGTFSTFKYEAASTFITSITGTEGDTTLISESVAAPNSVTLTAGVSSSEVC